MSKVLAIIPILIMLAYAHQHRENKKIIKNEINQSTIVEEVKASFSNKLTSDNQHDKCFTLEGSKRSWDAQDENVNEHSTFKVHKIIGKDGYECVFKVTKDEKDWLIPEGLDFCVDYKIPPIYCSGSGKSCVLVRNHCY